MRIRLAPLALSLLATSVAVLVAGVLAATLMPPIKARFMHGGYPTLVGVWVSIALGVATALILAAQGRRGTNRKAPRVGPGSDGPDKSP